MRFTVPDNYSVIVQGQLIQSRGGVIETDNKDMIEQLSKNPRCVAEQTKPEQPKRGRPAKIEQGA